MEEQLKEYSTLSVLAMLKRDLLDGKTVSSLYGFQRYHTVDLRKRLSDLRNNEGMNISYTWQENADGKRYKVHYMLQEDIANYKLAHNIQ